MSPTGRSELPAWSLSVLAVKRESCEKRASRNFPSLAVHEEKAKEATALNTSCVQGAVPGPMPHSGDERQVPL